MNSRKIIFMQREFLLLMWIDKISSQLEQKNRQISSGKNESVFIQVNILNCLWENLYSK